MIFIHHGTGIENALPDIIGNSTLVKPPYENLKKDALRDLVENFSQRWPVDNAALLAGPIDSVDRGEVLDLLLKKIEEPVFGAPRLILWARDYGSVPPTIRSRCGERYYFAPSLPHPLRSDAKRLLSSVKGQDILGVMSVLKIPSKGNLRSLLCAYIEEVLESGCVSDLYDGELRHLAQEGVQAVRVYDFFLRGM